MPVPSIQPGNQRVTLHAFEQCRLDMKVQEIAIHKRLKPQKLSARETPHATIEPNTTCNIRCSHCYCIEEAAVKSVSQVLDEIDLAIAKRNLDAVSLLGGEPTLHPDIVRIVQYVKSKGLVCLLLTNGVRFVRDGDVELLDALVQAGVDRFLVHIDQGQKHVHGDIHRARNIMFDMLDQRRVFYGLSLTLCPGEEDTLPGIMRTYAHHQYFDGILCILAFDLGHAFDEDNREFRTSMAKVYRGITEGLQIEPAAYFPSSTDDDEVCWLMYFYYLNVETGATFELSPEINRGFKALFRKVKGHHFFAETMRPEWLRVSLAATAAAELALHPRRASAFAKLLQGSHRTSALRFHYIVVQQAPLLDRDHGRVQICWQCPDATIRMASSPLCVSPGA